jgi:hypothetical protein
MSKYRLNSEAPLKRPFGEYQNHPFGSPTIPDWRRIEVALDGILPELVYAFENHSAASGAGPVAHS